MEDLLGKTIVTFFEECRKRYFAYLTAIFQGVGQNADFDFIKIFNESTQKDEIIERISLLLNDASFREFVLEQVRREKKEEISKRTREQLMAENPDVVEWAHLCAKDEKTMLEREQSSVDFMKLRYDM